MEREVEQGIREFYVIERRLILNFVEPNNKAIFRTFSWESFLGLLVLRISIAVVMAYAGYNYKENPVLISIILVIGLLGLLFIGTDRVIIYEDRIEFESSHLSIISSKKEVVYMNRIKWVETYTDGGRRYLGFTFRTGEEVVFSPKIDRDHYFKIVEIVKHYLP